MGNADRKNGNAVDIELNMSDITPINNEPDHHARETLVLLASAIRNGWQIPVRLLAKYGRGVPA